MFDTEDHVDTITRGGLAFDVYHFRDEQHGSPWDECDGHGPVSEWTSRAKLPGEWLLCEDRGSRRYYDAQEAQRMALADGWGALPHKLRLTYAPGDHASHARRGGKAVAGPFAAEDPEDINRAIASVYAQHKATMTRRQYAAAAVARDYEHLRRWCADDWCYIGVRVVLPCACCGEGEADSESVWGIESDADDYLKEVAAELADEILSRVADDA